MYAFAPPYFQLYNNVEKGLMFDDERYLKKKFEKKFAGQGW
jgi:hypothetical protein